MNFAALVFSFSSIIPNGRLVGTLALLAVWCGSNIFVIYEIATLKQPSVRSERTTHSIAVLDMYEHNRNDSFLLLHVLR
jgi:hypothetical protein